ncbi:MAG: DUF1284 domain-containing protein [Coriobacteriia bacterium]|nr:DUF1284 domain-containing protein [Coriobacteriia bacterium]
MSPLRVPRLRGHHLICLQFFRGEGYSEEFVANLGGVVERASSGRALVVAGADVVCAACPELGADGLCTSEDAGGEAEIARIDALALDILGVNVGERISLPEARDRLEDDAIGVGTWRAQACDGCAWERVCEPGWGAMLAAAERAARRP